MASLLPLIQDLLPMILPTSVHLVKGSDLIPPPAAEPGTADSNGDAGRPGPSRGIIHTHAIVDKSEKMCAAVLTVRPKSSTKVHHNAEQDAIIYAVSGQPVLATHPEDDDAEPKRHQMSAGDFAFVPAWTEHQMLNVSEEAAVLIIIRGGPQPTVVDLTEWGGPEAKPATTKKR